MSARDDQALLSSWLDGELSSAEEESLRRRLAEDPELSRELEQLKKASTAAREWFDGEADRLPDLRSSREDFIRTTLSDSSSREASAVHSRSWWQRPWPQVAAGTVLLIGLAILFRGGESSSERAVVFREAVEATLSPEDYIEIEVATARLLSDRAPVRVLYGPGGQWVVRAERSLLVAGVLAGRPDRRSVRIRHPGSIHLGSDGGRVWMWLEGEEFVNVAPLSKPIPLLRYFRDFLDESPERRDGTPLLHWGRVRDILKGVADDALTWTDVGEGTIDEAPVRRYEVSVDDKLRARLWVDPADIAVRRVQFGLLTLTFTQPEAIPGPEPFHWSHYAPAGIAVRQVDR